MFYNRVNGISQSALWLEFTLLTEFYGGESKLTCNLLALNKNKL